MTAAVAAAGPAVDRAALRAIARSAVASLHAELVLSPKPGLVCPGDRGSHDDMDATTMMRSLFALRHGFVAMVDAAAADAMFGTLQAIGIAAERAMRRATGDVNTHRGAIFTLGLLSAAAAQVVVRGIPMTPEILRQTLRARWGTALTMRPVIDVTHGRAMASQYRAGGARAEAAAGFPSVFDVVLPALRDARSAGHDERGARLQALMTAIADLEDTNLLYRGGGDGLRFAQSSARRFLACGIEGRDESLRAIGRDFVARRLSPGGSADLLAAALFVDRLTAPS
ncbi:MAG: triphosphoribosyl-dephospho-CoA synthase MdcB [Burkholderiaceae bacterium]